MAFKMCQEIYPENHRRKLSRNIWISVSSDASFAFIWIPVEPMLYLQ